MFTIYPEEKKIVIKKTMFNSRLNLDVKKMYKKFQPMKCMFVNEMYKL